MASALHIARLRKGAQAWNAWRAERPEVPIDLSGADLSGADLPEAALASVDLSHARLEHADLTGADLRGANLDQANLGATRLDGANLSGACNLTQGQIERAFGDKITVLPTGLVPPREWLRDAPITGVTKTRRRRRARLRTDDPYATLGVGRHASAREIRAAYLKLVKELHPDGRAADGYTPFATDSADEQLKAINEAYHEIRDSRRRARRPKRRSWAGRSSAIFMVGAFSSAAPALLILAFVLYYADWLGPQAAPTATVPGGQPPGTASAASQHTKDRFIDRQTDRAEARRQGTKAAWEQFLRAYPAGEHAAEAREALAAIAQAEARARDTERAEMHRREEAAAWASAVSSGTETDLQRFLDAYPDSDHVGRARQAVATIERAEARRREEVAAWASAVSSGTKADLQRFLDAYPDSDHVGRARQALGELAAAEALAQAELAAWTAADRDGGKAAVGRYLADFPSGEHAADAKTRLAALELEERDAAAWLAAQERDSKAAYAGYLTAHPDGLRAAAARRRMTELERSEARAREARAHEARLETAVRALPRTQYLPDAPEPFVGADGRIRR